MINKTYIFDLDGTICTNTNGEYQSAKPFIERIKYINRLFDIGNKIIIHTARGMGTFNGNAELANKEYYEFTKTQLENWGLKYNNLILGKPSGDYYIDDKGCWSEDFFVDYE